MQFTKKIILPNSVISIEDKAFWHAGRGSSNRQTIQFGNSLKTIGISAFKETDVTALHFPESLETIGAEAFCECKDLKSIAFIDNSSCQIKVGDKAFKDCHNLTEVYFGNSVESIGKEAFSSSSVQNLNFPNTLKEIGDGAFSHCTDLKKFLFQIYLYNKRLLVIMSLKIAKIYKKLT